MNGSGTTMLLDCLAGHSMLFGFRGETKVLPYFIDHQSDYGDLSDDDRFRELWQDLKASFGLHRWPPSADASLAAAVPRNARSAAGVFDALMTSLASAEGKSIWCEKTPMYVHHMTTLASAFPRSSFVHVVRDGRNCAASFHRRWLFHPVRTAHRWKKAVRTGRSTGALLGSRYFEVRYEQLTSSPEPTLRDLCRFLGIPFEPQILNPARLRPQMTGSNASGIISNKRRAVRYFGKSTIRRIEGVCGKALQEFGYVVEHEAGDIDPPSWKLRLWELGDDARRLWAALRRSTSIPPGARLAFLRRRVRGAVKQKRTLN
jgi:hypothetical protein